MTPAIHTESKVRGGDRFRQKLLAQVAQAAWGVQRLLPVEHRGRVIGWVGWCTYDQRAYVIEHKPWMDSWIDRHGFFMGFPTIDALIKAETVSGKLKQTWWHKWSYTAGPTTLGWSHWYMVDGWPAPGVWNGTAYTARQHSDAEAGAFQHGGNVSTDTKHLLSGFATVNATSAENNVWCLYDMVLSYDACTISNSLQSFTNTLTAQRYNGTGLPGLSIMGCANTTTGNTGYSAINYTNQSGTAAQAVPNVTALLQKDDATAPGTGHAAVSCFAITNSNIRAILTCPLVAGDSGARKIESLQMASTTTDQHNYILGFLIAWITVPHGFGTNPFDLVKASPSVPRVYDGACLTLAGLNNGSTAEFYGGLNYAWGS